MPSFIGRHIHRLTDRMRSERGIALPMAMMALFVVSALSTVAATAATSGAGQSDTDRSVKRALAAVDAGLQAATYRTNKIESAADECVTLDANGSLAISDPLNDTWCAPQSEDLGEGASLTYRVSQASSIVQNGQTLLQRKIVATGCVLAGATPAQCLAGAGVKRRAVTTLAAPQGQLFAGKGVLSKETISVGNNGSITADVISNDDVDMGNNSTICGNVTYGPSAGDDFIRGNNSNYNCPGKSANKAQQEFVLGPVDGSAARASNDNARIGNGLDPKSGTVTLPAHKGLTLGNDATLTLTGDVYSFCHIQMGNNSSLYIASRAAGRPPLKIFIDTPENCAAAGSNKGSVNFGNNSRVDNQTLVPAMLQLFVEGSTNPSLPTNVTFQNNSSGGQKMVVYAPNSNFSVQNNGGFSGAVAAKRVTVGNNGGITWDPSASTVLDENVEPLYQRQSWLECPSQASGSAPDSGC